MTTLRTRIEQALQFLQALDLRQRLFLGAGGVLTVALLLVFIRQLSTSTYKPLISGISPEDARAVSVQLTAKKIPHMVDSNGTGISVLSESLDAARLELATQGVPHGGRLGFEIFDKVLWGETEFDEKVNYQRALEGELERTIQQLGDVSAARVHLVLPAESVFVDRQRSAKASVILKLRRGRLSPESQSSIARLVAGAVDGLSPDAVAVIDADTSRPLGESGHDAVVAESLDEQLTRRLLATLSPVVGAEHLRASVNVEYDPGTLDESREQYDPAGTVTLTLQRSEEKVGAGALIAGPVGTSSNIPTAKAEANPLPDNSQNSISESATYGVNKTVRHLAQPAGRIRRISAALLVDDLGERRAEDGKNVSGRRKWDASELKQLQELAQAALGLDAVRGDTISVQNIAFEQQAPQSIEPVSVLERGRVLLQRWSVLIRYAAILTLFLATYAMVLRPITTQAIATIKELPAHNRRVLTEVNHTAQSAGLEGEVLVSLGEAPQRARLLKKQVVEKVQREPQTSSRLVQAWLRED